MDVMIEKLVAIPLKHQPGTAWEYSVGADIQGAVIERVSGQPFADFLQTRIFDPLNMDDTGFALTPEAAARAATLHAPSDDGGFVPFGNFADIDATVMPSLPSGGGGLWSTVEDYAPFLEMLMNGGELDGVRYLQPETVELILTDQLPEGLTATASVRQAGFGLGLAIAADQSVSGQALPGGTITWPGIYGVYWWADRENDLIVFTVMQVMVTTARGKENLGEVGPASLYGLITE
jgi:CubicO group peptidase (beta-lactamase class C family)